MSTDTETESTPENKKLTKKTVKKKASTSNEKEKHTNKEFGKLEADLEKSKTEIKKLKKDLKSQVVMKDGVLKELTDSIEFQNATSLQAIDLRTENAALVKEVQLFRKIVAKLTT